MKNKWRFFGLFVLYSFVLSLGWYAVYADYIHLPAKAADFVLSVLGYTGDVVQIATRDNSHYLRFPEHAPTKAYQALNMVFNIVPFIALCLATPKTTWFGRLEIIIYGCIALFDLGDFFSGGNDAHLERCGLLLFCDVA